MPAAQMSQTEAPAAEYLPAAQLAQVEATLAPTAKEDLPAAQLAQAEAPAAEYVPAAQLAQVEAAVPENLPAVHPVHVAATLHAALKPVSVSEESALKPTLRKPVIDE